MEFVKGFCGLGFLHRHGVGERRLAGLSIRLFPRILVSNLWVTTSLGCTRGMEIRCPVLPVLRFPNGEKLSRSRVIWRLCTQDQ